MCAITVDVKFSEKQKRVLDTLADQTVTEMLIGGGGYGGKTFFGCYWVMKNILKYNGSRWFIARKELKKLRTTTFPTLRDEIFPLFKLKQDRDYHYNQVDSVITFRNGSILYLIQVPYIPSDPDYNYLGSTQYTGGFIDESQEITLMAKDILVSRCRYKTSMFGLSGQILMSCNPSKNFLRTQFYLPSIKNELPPYRKYQQILAFDNPFADPRWIEKMKFAKKDVRERILYGNWDYTDEPDQLVYAKWLDNVFVKNSDIDWKNGTRKVGVDCARQGNDKTVLSYFVGGVLVDMVVIEVDITDTTDISGKIAEYIIDYCVMNKVGYSNTNVDVIGVGAGVVDALRARGFFVNSFSAGAKVGNKQYIYEEATDSNNDEYQQRRFETAYTFSNLRSKCLWDLRHDIQVGKFKILEGIEYFEELKTDLISHKYTTNEKLISVEGKEELKKRLGHSPDFSDSVYIGRYSSQPLGSVTLI